MSVLESKVCKMCKGSKFFSFTPVNTKTPQPCPVCGGTGIVTAVKGTE